MDGTPRVDQSLEKQKGKMSEAALPRSSPQSSLINPPTADKEFLHAPNVIADAGGHSGSNAEALVHPAEVVIGVVQADCVAVVLILL
jgi:hypothetical protein